MTREDAPSGEAAAIAAALLVAARLIAERCGCPPDGGLAMDVRLTDRGGAEIARLAVRL